MVVPDICRHEAANVNVSLPDVVVLSEYVPLDLAIQVPVTRRDPVTGAGAQFKPNTDMSSLPVTSRHDDVTVQVPTTSPPQGCTLEQDAPPAPPLELPPVPRVPPLAFVPPVAVVPAIPPPTPPLPVPPPFAFVPPVAIAPPRPPFPPEPALWVAPPVLVTPPLLVLPPLPAVPPVLVAPPEPPSPPWPPLLVLPPLPAVPPVLVAPPDPRSPPVPLLPPPVAVDVGNVRGARPQAATAHTASSKTVPSLPVGPMLRKHCYAKSCWRP
jgi:hypothetical protein